MKSLLYITAYAPTVDKQELLMRCIESCKALGVDILISSHAPLPEHIIRSVDYFIYDTDNRFSKSEGICFWKQVGNTTINIFGKKSHEFPIIKAIRNALYIAKGNGYEFMYGTDFDNIFSAEDIEKLIELKNRVVMEDKEVFFFYPPDASWILDGVSLKGIYYDIYVFGGYTNTILDAFDSYFPKTLEEYNDTLGHMVPNRPQCLEHYFYNAFQGVREKTLTINSYVKEYLTSSIINASTLNSTSCWILPASDGKHYVYMTNDNVEDYTFNVLVDDVHRMALSLNGRTIEQSFHLMELTEDCSIRVEVYNLDNLINTHYLEYRVHDTDKYVKDGNIQIKDT